MAADQVTGFRVPEVTRQGRIAIKIGTAGGDAGLIFEFQGELQIQNDLLQEALFIKGIPASLAYPSLQFFQAPGRLPESDGNGDPHLVEVGDIVHKGEHLAGVDEPQGRRQTDSLDTPGLADAIETAIGRRKGLYSPGRPLSQASRRSSPLPGDAGLSGGPSISLPHPHSLIAPDLLQGEVIRQGLRKAHAVQTQDHLEP